MTASVTSTEAQEGQPTSGFWALTLGSIGVVFGDIGTSPLYAFREAASHAAEGEAVSRIIVLGVLSLILWSLFIVVTAKYVLLLLRADNNGEGGTLSLMALGQRALGRRSWLLLALGVVGASMFIGDSMITPAISVLSAVEGLKLVTPALGPYVVPLTIFILVVLFSVQSSGTARVASLFGPVMVVWFATLAILGLVHISDDPTVLYAINPYYAIHFMLSHGVIGLVTMGLVFLAVTGGEALYADLGHFGRKPIQAGWFYLVLPALLINYFGQGALVLSDPTAIENPFYKLAPEVLLLPLVVLATAATVIASQAVITGAYSLIRQAVQLGLLPRFEVRYTSETHAGQIYLPRVNRLLLIGVVLLVLLFRTSSGLASAYGIAVSTTMVVDGIMGFVVIWKLWNWKAATAAAVILPFVVVDMSFFAANLLKLLDGAWLLFGMVVAVMIWTWRRGAAILVAKTRRIEVPLTDLIKSLEKRPPHIVKGTAVFLTSDPAFVPTALMHNLKHNKVLHEHNVILTIETAETPRVDPAERVKMETISEKFSTVRLRFGFMESPNVPKALVIARKLGWQFDIMATSFFVSRRSLKPSAQSGMPLWQDHLFIAMSRSANDATDYFQIPTGRVVEVGTQVTI
jgi:KUP system potassium uptake protein